MSKNRKKIAIVWANPYNKNLGVAALAYSSLSLIQDVLDENSIDGDITFVGSYKRGTDSVTINGKNIQYNNIIGLDYFHWKSWAKIILRPGQYDISKLLSFDYIFDIAEGDSFTDIYGQNRFGRIYHSKVLFHLLRKQQVLLPQTIGPFNQESKRKMAEMIMKKMTAVLSRDKNSYDYTASFLPDDKIGEFIDVAFYMPFSQQQVQDNKIHIGINVSGLLWNGGYTGKNQFNMKTDYKGLVLRVLDYFNSLDWVQIHIVSHVIPEDSPVEDDSIVAKEIEKLYPTVIVSPRFKTPIEAKSYISGLHFFTGGRMHACIGAFSSGVPVVPMAYSRKFNGLFCDTLEYKWVGDCVNMSTDEVFQIIKEGFEKRDELRSQIEKSETTIVKPRLSKLKEVLLDFLTK